MSASEELETMPRRSPARLWMVLGALVVLLALALTPPLLNVSRFRLRIANSMSESLGRKVTLDNVHLHLLPMPGLTLEGLVVSEDPAFGYEPIVRANQVEVTLRPSSLWRRQVEVSKIRFVVDSQGAGASLNIVRNAQGRWNLQEIFVQAARVTTAPTSQRKAGPAPRFPYIEATGARVNLKLGDEKMPFSLTEAEFALWLPDAGEWEVRLKGKPARTDTNASDTGEIKLEGQLGKAATLSAVPVKLTASWAHAQMGQASRLFQGHDAGWRGTVDMGVSLTGPLGAASLVGDAHLSDLRRAEFVPAKLLDVSTHCTATANATTVTLTDLECAVPDGGPEPIRVSVAALDLQRPLAAPVDIAMKDLPLAWGLDWSRLFSQRVSAEFHPEGTVEGTMQRAAGDASDWSGFVTLKADTPKTPLTLEWKVESPEGDGFLPVFALEPVVLQPGLTLTGKVDAVGYSLKLAGTGTAEQVAALGRILPPLADGVGDLVDGRGVEVACSRPWGAAQQCSTEALPVAKKRR